MDKSQDFFTQVFPYSLFLMDKGYPKSHLDTITPILMYIFPHLLACGMLLGCFLIFLYFFDHFIVEFLCDLDYNDTRYARRAYFAEHCIG